MLSRHEVRSGPSVRGSLALQRGSGAAALGADGQQQRSNHHTMAPPGVNLSLMLGGDKIQQKMVSTKHHTVAPLGMNQALMLGGDIVVVHTAESGQHQTYTAGVKLNGLFDIYGPYVGK